MLAFGASLKKIRQQVSEDLGLSGLPKRKVLAAVVRILDRTCMRIGNEQYAKQNDSYGLTTLKDNHVKISGTRLRFHFRGKSGQTQDLELDDQKLAKIVRTCRDIPGYELFQYVDEEGGHCRVDSAMVNEYLREITGEDFTAKDFRTWGGTVLAAMALQEFEKFDTKTQAKKNLIRAIEAVAQRLGNTPAVCRKCYIHPLILNSYLDGTMLGTMQKRAEQELRSRPTALKPEEHTVLEFLRKRLAAERRNNRSTLLEKLEASVRHRKKQAAPATR
jgi:DNA topoisomerase-1